MKPELDPDNLLSFGEWVDVELKKLGVKLPGRPTGDIPDLPADITNTTSSVVSQLLSELCSWLDYLTPQVAKMKTEAKLLKRDAQVAKKLGHSEEEVDALEGKALMAQGMADVLEALEKGTLRKKEAASREITRLVGTPQWDGYRPPEETGQRRSRGS